MNPLNRSDQKTLGGALHDLQYNSSSPDDERTQQIEQKNRLLNRLRPCSALPSRSVKVKYRVPKPRAEYQKSPFDSRPDLASSSNQHGRVCEPVQKNRGDFHELIEESTIEHFEARRIQTWLQTFFLLTKYYL